MLKSLRVRGAIGSQWLAHAPHPVLTTSTPPITIPNPPKPYLTLTQLHPNPIRPYSTLSNPHPAPAQTYPVLTQGPTPNSVLKAPGLGTAWGLCSAVICYGVHHCRDTWREAKHLEPVSAVLGTLKMFSRGVMKLNDSSLSHI